MKGLPEADFLDFRHSELGGYLGDPQPGPQWLSGATSDELIWDQRSGLVEWDGNCCAPETGPGSWPQLYVVAKPRPWQVPETSRGAASACDKLGQ